MKISYLLCGSTYSHLKFKSTARITIVEQRRQMESILEASPSLIPYLSEMFGQGQVYVNARKDAAKETKLPLEAFPSECPWSIEQVLDEDYLVEVESLRLEAGGTRVFREAEPHRKLARENK